MKYIKDNIKKYKEILWYNGKEDKKNVFNYLLRRMVSEDIVIFITNKSKIFKQKFKSDF